MTSRASWMRPTTGRATSSSQRTWRDGLRRGACPAPGHPREVLGGHPGRAAPQRPRRQPAWRGRWISPRETASEIALADVFGRSTARSPGCAASARRPPPATVRQPPQGVWIFVRASSRAVLEQGTLPEMAGGNLPGTMPPPERRSQRLASEPHARPADASAPQRSRARARASRLAIKGTTQIRQYGVLAGLKRLGEAGGEDRGRSGQIASSLADE